MVFPSALLSAHLSRNLSPNQWANNRQLCCARRQDWDAWDKSLYTSLASALPDVWFIDLDTSTHRDAQKNLGKKQNPHLNPSGI
jgi:hypothetical protein